jgi:hypothetical protein
MSNIRNSSKKFKSFSRAMMPKKRAYRLNQIPRSWQTMFGGGVGDENLYSQPETV